MISVLLNGVEIDRYTKPSTPHLSSKLNARGTADMTLTMNPGVAYRPQKLDEVYMVDTDTGRTIFGGVLWEFDRELMLNKRREYALQFVDFTQLADRENVFGELSNKHAGELVQWIIDRYLAQHGVTAGTIEQGSLYKKTKFNGKLATEELNSLADRDGFTWRIDAEKRLHFIGRESFAAPFNITDEHKPVRNLKVKETADGYRNIQYFRGPANGISDSRTESYPGNGALREFAVRYDLASVPTVKVNGVAKTVGIRGVDSGKDWYWAENSNLLTQDEGGAVLTASDTLAVTYSGYFSIFVVVEDGDAITQHGRFSALDEDTSLPYLDLCLDKAETLMRKNDWNKGTVTYETDEPGLEAGMVQLISLTDDEINASVLITSVESKENFRAGFPLTFTVMASIGERAEDWLDFYRRIAKRQAYDIRPDEVIMQSGRIQATCLLSDSMAVVTTPMLVWDTGSWDGGAGFW